MTEPEGSDSIDLSTITGGIPPESIPALDDVRPLEPVYPLLHALLGGSLDDFLVRAAAVTSLVSADLGTFAREDLDECLYWIVPERRDAVIRALRRNGWLDRDTTEGYSITTAGRWAYDILSFLHRRLADSELLPTLAGVEYALQIGLDPIRHLRSMRSRLLALKDRIVAARASHSEVVLRRSSHQLQQALDLSRQVRAVLDRISTENAEARAVVRDIHDLLSRLHGMGAELQAAITEVGRQLLRLTAGLTVDQIVTALMSADPGELARVGRESLRPVHVPPPLVTTPTLAAAAEQQFAREFEEAVETEWTEPAEAPRQADVAAIPAEVLALLADLDEIERKGQSVPLADLVPRGSRGESFLRASLLTLLSGSGEGEGVAARLGALALAVRCDGDGWPERLAKGPLRGLTPGAVAPEEKE